MPRSADLHGSAPDDNPDALLIIDLISDFDFPDGTRLLHKAAPLADTLKRLKSRAQAAGVPVIYVNDNRGRWQSDRSDFVAHCIGADSKGRHLASALRPDAEDYFVFKPKHSAFFATPLDALLKHLGTQRLVLAGVTVEQCILMTAIEAYLRDFKLLIVRDAVTGLRQCDAALQYLEEILQAEIKPAARIRFARKKRVSG
jgi:nicotinamidase-related amidase